MKGDFGSNGNLERLHWTCHVWTGSAHELVFREKEGKESLVREGKEADVSQGREQVVPRLEPEWLRKQGDAGLWKLPFPSQQVSNRNTMWAENIILKL